RADGRGRSFRAADRGIDQLHRARRGGLRGADAAGARNAGLRHLLSRQRYRPRARRPALDGGGAVSAVRALVDLLAGRRDAAGLSPREWDGVISVARAEALLGTLAVRLDGAALPAPVAALFADQRAAAEVAQHQAL